MQNKKMKAKSLLLGALATGLLASCSDDRVTGMSSLANGGEITYSAVANKATRATDLYNNSNKPEGFYVWAALEDGSAYISGDQVTTEDEGKTYTDVNGTHYWPSGSLDFYATNLADASLDVTATPTIAYSVASTVADQLDLLYAVELGQTKGTTGVVALNFRHALSQIVFKAENDDANLYVEITGVGVNNVAGTGTFTFPSASTSDNVPTSAGPYPTTTVGTWDVGTYSGTAGTNASYSIALANTVSLAGSASDSLTFGETALLLLPQSATASSGFKESEINGAYLTLQCAIYNVAGTTYVPGTDYQIFGTEGASATVYFPVAIDWAPGMKYTYNFVFGGTSGSGDGYGEDENDDPVLVPITYTVDVDEFVEVDAINEEVIASSSTGTINGHEYVDLGLSVYWAACNVGAESPDDYGTYFQWGEITEPADGNYAADTDHCRLYGVSTDDIGGNPEYDAATANWGEPWRLPTQAEISELVSKCTSTGTTLNGVNGYEVTGTNGKSIFLPAAGFYNETKSYDAEKGGYYWSSTPDGSSTGRAWGLSLDNSDFGLANYDRPDGQSIRPVRDK